MCGIAGIVDLEESVDSSLLEKLGQSLAHRGPDGQRVFVTPNRDCGLVHRRLAILDPHARSDQPFTSGDGRFTIVFNGEIFNFLELRAELTELGHKFLTESDTEVLVQSYMAWGPQMLDRLNGMWAFAIHDNTDNSLFLARDRFGVKPLLYALRGRKFAFASEVRCLLEIDWVERALNMLVARRLLFDPMSVEGSEFTLHQGIRRLPGGHFAILRDGELRTTRWWTTSEHFPGVAPSSLEDAAERFRELFIDAVRLRMRSDVPIATCLSGGFDSTAVISTMNLVDSRMGMHARESTDWRHAFVATFPGHDNDESEMAKLAASYAGAAPHVLDLGRDDGRELLEHVLDALDDVYISLPTAPYRIYQAVRQAGLTVTLDGHGADEMIGGYRQGGQLASFLRSNAIGDKAGGAWNGKLTDVAKLLALRAGGDFHLRDCALAPPERLPIVSYRDPLPSYYSNFDRRLYAMYHASVLPTILRNFDRLSMAHGVEVRMPFMDWRLATFALALPDSMKANAHLTKLVAREAMAGIIPEPIRTSPRKVGFNSQMPAWLNGTLGDWALHLLEGTNPAFDALVDRSSLRQRVATLTTARAWDWRSVGRLWPYINLKWYLERRCG